MAPGEFVLSAMRDCLPEGVPLSFTLVSARWITRRKRAVATVTMFDGLPAELEVWAWAKGAGRAHHWNSMSGGAASFEGGRWVRVDELERGEAA